MKIKVQRKEIEVNSNDRILFNGACYILITREIFKDYGYYHPTISKTQFKKLQKESKIVLSKEKYKTPYAIYPLFEFVEDKGEE